ncbi:MAG: hypothetical protein II976_00530, partial [Alistipes sp.]|nr:hypothetical protein [Alistipes sp.]
RAGLKHQWGNPSRFDPGSGYKERNESPSLFFVSLTLICRNGNAVRQWLIAPLSLVNRRKAAG